MIDKKAPAVSCWPFPSWSDNQGWSAVDVSVPCFVTDNGSGLADIASYQPYSADPPTWEFQSTTDVQAGSETNDALTNPKMVCDNVGNCVKICNDIKAGCATAGLYGQWVDKKGPAAGCQPPNPNGYTGTAVIACSPTDGGSGVVLGDASFTLSASGAPGTVNGCTNSRTIHDNVGNATVAGPICGIKFN
jgi:hypothetical protein